MPDYTKELQEIAAALSRPSTPVWLAATVSTILGFFSASLLQRLAERSKLKRLKRVLYVDLAEVFLTVEGIMGFCQMDELQRWEWQKEQLKLHVGFKGEAYLRANEDTYMQMSERAVADNVYTYLHVALDDLDHWWHVNWSLARQVFARAVCEDGLKRKCFRQFLGKERAEMLHGQCSSIYEKSQRVL
jgi:hypothetical protein